MSDANPPAELPAEESPPLDIPIGAMLDPEMETELAVELIQPAPACDVLDVAPPSELGPDLAQTVEALASPDGLPAAAPPGPDTLAADLHRRLDALADALGRRLDGLQAQFDREVRAEATRERVVDRLHAELQEYKQDLLLSVLRPVFVDLIQLHDDLGKMAEALPADEPVDPSRVRGLLEGVQQGLEDVLYRQGVEPFHGEEPSFDPRRQRAVATVPTDDPALNKAIAARLRKGFRSGERVIRPEVVSVFALKK